MAKSVNPEDRPPHLEGYPVSYSTYTNHKCRCEGCWADHKRRHKQWRDNTSPEMRRRMNRRQTRRLQQNVQAAREQTPNLRKPWTEAEKRVAADTSLSVRQAAELLGRTYFSVKQMRHELRKR